MASSRKAATTGIPTQKKKTASQSSGVTKVDKTEKKSKESEVTSSQESSSSQASTVSYCSQESAASEDGRSVCDIIMADLDIR